MGVKCMNHRVDQDSVLNRNNSGIPLVYGLLPPIIQVRTGQLFVFIRMLTHDSSRYMCQPGRTDGQYRMWVDSRNVLRMYVQRKQGPDDDVSFDILVLDAQL